MTFTHCFPVSVDSCKTHVPASFFPSSSIPKVEGSNEVYRFPCCYCSCRNPKGQSRGPPCCEVPQFQDQAWEESVRGSARKSLGVPVVGLGIHSMVWCHWPVATTQWDTFGFLLKLKTMEALCLGPSGSGLSISSPCPWILVPWKAQDAPTDF